MIPVMTIVWLIAIVVFAVVEAVTAGLVSIWFVVGSLAALIAAIAGASELVQIILFVAVSAIALAATRPLVKKYARGKSVPTNLDRVIGETGKVTEDINNDNATGAVYVDGKTWTARSLGGTVIPAGEQVQIVKMEGVRLFVKLSEKLEVVK